MLKFSKLNRIKTAALVSLSAAALVLGACAKEEKAATGPRTEITFAVLAVEKSQNLEKLWSPIIADMQKQTGLKVKPYYSSSYTALIEAMRFDQVQTAWFSNASGLEAMKRANGEVFAHTSYPDGEEGYHSIIIVQKDSKLTVADILKCDKSLNFGMGDVKSTSGTVAPKAYLFLPNKVDPNTCFKNVKSASHGVNIEGVVAGVLDAATNNSTALMELNDTPEGKAKLDKLKIIWTSPLLPTDVIEYRSDLDPATKEKLRSFFLSYGQGTGAEADRQRANLRAVQWGPLKPDDNSHFLPERLMEARVALAEAQNAHDDAAVKAAQAEITTVEAETAKKAAKTAPEAPADKPASN